MKKCQDICTIIEKLRIMEFTCFEFHGDSITEMTENAIGKRLTRILNTNGLAHITFHDLRHLNASVMLMLGIPDKYAMERGGWSSPNI